MSENCSLFDPKVPSSLQQTQKWFASIITRPVDENSKMNLIAPSGRLMAEEAKDFIAPSSRLDSYQRIELYNQQYWWRMLSALHVAFPLLTRLFGYTLFNQVIGMPYLEKYPSNHWSIAHVGSRLVQWLHEHYHEDDRILILNAAKIDWAFDMIFITLEYPTIDPTTDSATLASEPLYLQTYVETFHLPYDLFTFRTTFVKEEGDYWIDHDFPELPKDKENYYFVLYRTHKNRTGWKEITAGEYHLLSSFKKGATVEQACEELEKREEIVYNDALTNIASWFQEWVTRRWLCLSNTIISNR